MTETTTTTTTTTCKHGYSGEGQHYADGGQEYRCAAYVGAPDELCGETYYVCPHGVEAPSVWERESHCMECSINA